MSTKSWHLSRRTVLRGIGASLALPAMEAMKPLGLAAAPAAAKPPLRMAFLFIPNGVNMQYWRPAAEGPLTNLPDTLKPLQNVRDQLLVISGLAHDKARAHGDGPGDHARSNATFLTGAHPYKTDGKDIRVGVSIDQFAAQEIGDETRLPSLELGTESGRQAGGCDSGYSCAYSSNISWRTPTQPMAKEINPRKVFERLFGDPEKVAGERDALAQAAARRSILDVVREDARSLRARLGVSDLHKLDEYLESVRYVEKQIQAAEKNPRKLPPAEDLPDLPEGAPRDTAAHLRLMADLLILAFQTDTTRIATLMFANEGSDRTFPALGVTEGHHSISHHGKNAEKTEQIRKIDHFYVQQLAYLLAKMQDIKEGKGTLLDNCMLVYGCAISDGDRHNHEDLPVILAGRGGGTIRTGRHLKLNKETPMCNLFVSMLERMGVKAGAFGDSTGKLNEIAG
jgi:hypothetical protein